MTPQQILHNLHLYQKWRRGGKIPQPNPKEVGETLDEVIRLLRKIEKNPDWEQRRYEIAVAVMSNIRGLPSQSDVEISKSCETAIQYADEIIKQLKGER